MTTLTNRATKGSELTHGELDANFDRDVQVKTTTYACLVSDNRSVIECNHASTPFTVTLGDAATMAAADTGDYEVTIANIGAAAVTVARAGSDTIDGAATSIVLQQYSSVTLKVNAATDGYNTIAQTVTGLANLTAAEVAILDGATVTTAELNILDGVTASAGDLSATTNFEETISATTSEVTIATAKTLNVTDNSGFKINGTAITSTAAELNILDGVTSTASELNILDGVTSTAAEINELDASAAAVTNYVHGIRTYFHDDSAHATTLDISTNISTTFETVGPTGAGATNTWTALDDLPTGAVGAIIKVRNNITGSTTSTNYYSAVYARANGSGTAASARTAVSYTEFRNTDGTSTSSTDIQTVIVPVDSNGIFEMAWANTSTTAGVEAYLLGFIV